MRPRNRRVDSNMVAVRDRADWVDLNAKNTNEPKEG